MTKDQGLLTKKTWKPNFEPIPDTNQDSLCPAMLHQALQIPVGHDVRRLGMVSEQRHDAGNGQELDFGAKFQLQARLAMLKERICLSTQ